MNFISSIFTPVLLEPMVNFLVLLNNVLFGSFGLAIIAFTIVIRLLTWPLTIRQLHQTRAMQTIQPRVAEINKKYSDPKRRQEEIMKAYRESGVNPLGCIGPMLLQIPILLALFFAIRYTLPESPEALERLAGHLYPWDYLQHAIPIKEHFLGMDLRSPNVLLIVLVGLTSFLQTKTTPVTSTDERARAQQQMMAYLMPAMFVFISLNFPSGVALYWVVNSVVGILFNMAVYGLKTPWYELPPLLKTPPRPVSALAEQKVPPAKATTEPARELRTANGIGRSKRQNRRRRP